MEVVGVVDPLLQTQRFRALERRQRLARAVMLVGFLVLFIGCLTQGPIPMWLGFGLLAPGAVLRVWLMIDSTRASIQVVRRGRRRSRMEPTPSGRHAPQAPGGARRCVR